MKRILSYKRIYILGLIPVTLLLIFAAKSNSYFAEKIFALHINKWLSEIVSTITGIVPFSIAELLMVVLLFAVIILLIRWIRSLAVRKENRRGKLFEGILNILCVCSILWFSFTVMAGLNYYRYPFSSYSNLQISNSSVDELFQLTKSLALEANSLRGQTTARDEQGVFQLSMSKYELAKLADQAYDKLSMEYPVLGGSYGAPKPVLLSKLMSNTEITGIYFPFTAEANVNVDIPDYSIPSTMLHEMAHQRGFMREDEANYIAYLAGIESDSAELKYSSTMLALVVSGNALYEQNPDLYFQIRDMYSEGLNLDIRANSSYWAKYEDTVVSTFSNTINDTYLKANAQTDGVKSYGRMLDLLLAKYRKDHRTK